MRVLDEEDHVIRARVCEILQSSSRRALSKENKKDIALKLKDVQDFIYKTLGEPCLQENCVS